MDVFRFSPQDEFPHPPGAERNFNESVYLNAFDLKSGIGGWMRIGNRPNEGYAELSICFYLAGGAIACRFQRVGLIGNSMFSAEGLTMGVRPQSGAVGAQFEGELYLLEDPAVLRDPKNAFSKAKLIRCEFDWQAVGESPIHGGEPTSPQQETMYGRDFSFGHFNQHVSVAGELLLGDVKTRFQGLGWRDHSWGPRYWQAIYAYRLFLANLGDGYGFMLLKLLDSSGHSRRQGVLMIDGGYEEVTDLDLKIDWDRAGQAALAWIGARTAKRAVIIEAKPITTAPLRNRRKVDQGFLVSRIRESQTEFRWGERKGLGMMEFIERLENGVAVGFPL